MLNLVKEDMFYSIRGSAWYGVACPETQFTVCTLPFWGSKYIMTAVFCLPSVMLPVINKNYVNALQDCESILYVYSNSLMYVTVKKSTCATPFHSTPHCHVKCQQVCPVKYSMIRKMDSISYVYISWTIHGMWMIYITFERGGPKFSNTARALT